MTYQPTQGDHPFDVRTTDVDPSRELGLAICRALDIDPDLVTGITLELNVDEQPHITIRRLGMGTQLTFGYDLMPVLARYKLTPIDDDQTAVHDHAPT